MNVTNFNTYIKQTYKRTDKNTEILQALNDSIMAVAIKMPHGAYKYQSYVLTVQGQEDYALPSTIMHLMHPIRLLDGSDSASSGYTLEHIDKKEYDELQPNPNRTSPSTGSPSAYTVYSGSILLTPVADSSTDILEINWSKRPTTLIADIDLPALGSEWDEVLKQMVLSRLYALIELFDESAYWRNQYEDQQGNPVGLYKDLIEIEKDREYTRINTIKSNNL
jgi:hypothetical protein